MKWFYCLAILGLAVCLYGCGTKIVIENPKGSFIYVQQSSDQKTTNDIPIDIPIDIPVDLVKGGIPKIGELLHKPTSALVKPEVEVPPEVKEPVEPTGQRIALKPTKESGKNWTWLPTSGVDIGHSVTFSFPECNSVLEVVDPSKAWGADGNAENYNQSYYFSGNPDLQKDVNMSCEGGCASVFAPPGCDATYVLMK